MFYADMLQYSITWDIQAEPSIGLHTRKKYHILETYIWPMVPTLKIKTYLYILYEIIQHKIIAFGLFISHHFIS